MKKFIYILILFISIFLISCNNKYKITIEDNGFIYDKPTKVYYKKGDVIRLHANIINDADLYMYINDEVICTPVYLVDNNDRYVWEYSYTVSDSDAMLVFKIVSNDKVYYNLCNLIDDFKEINNDNLKMVSIEVGYIGVDPNKNTPDFSCSSVKETINYNVSILYNANLEKISNYDIDGGIYKKVIYTLKNDIEYELYIMNFVVKVNGNYYKFVNTDDLPRIIYSN